MNANDYTGRMSARRQRHRSKKDQDASEKRAIGNPSPTSKTDLSDSGPKDVVRTPLVRPRVIVLNRRRRAFSCQYSDHDRWSVAYYGCDELG